MNQTNRIAASPRLVSSYRGWGVSELLQIIASKLPPTLICVRLDICRSEFIRETSGLIQPVTTPHQQRLRVLHPMAGVAPTGRGFGAAMANRSLTRAVSAGLGLIANAKPTNTSALKITPMMPLVNEPSAGMSSG